MACTRQLRESIVGLSLGAATAALASAFVLMVIAIQPAQAQTFKVLYNFTNGADGSFPYAGLTMDRGGNLYGTAYFSETGKGTVYRLRRSGSNWVFDLLYSFTGSPDGFGPLAGVTFGSNGTLYGTTYFGGNKKNGCTDQGCGTVFNLRPPVSVCKSILCPWVETVLYRFDGASDGASPTYGELVFDQAGNIYGTTTGVQYGNVYQLTPSGSSWTENVLISFSGYDDGGLPENGVISDNAGNLYGTTDAGGLYDGGTVFQLTPSGLGWTENILYNAFPNGSDVLAGVIFGRSGILYGATSNGGSDVGGTVFNLTPSGGSWTYGLLYTFANPGGSLCGPRDSLVQDGAGNLYGTTKCDGAYGHGNVFKLTPSGGGWIYTSLHDFTGGDDGSDPVSHVLVGGDGNLYGTTSIGGSHRLGNIWEITP